MKTIRKIRIIGLLIFRGCLTAKAQPYQPITFEKYLLEVAGNNLEYLSEKYNVRMAEAKIAIQRMFPDPELTFETTEDDFNLELGYTLEMGKRRSRVGLAQSEAELERLALDWFFQELRAEAAEAFLEAVLQRQMLEVKRQSYEYMARLAEYDSLRYTLGEISKIDARQTSLEAATLLTEVYEQEGEYRAAVVLLNQYMGNDSGVLFDPQGDWANVDKKYELGYLIGFGMEHRVDLVAAHKSVDMALQNMRLVRAERRPDVDVMVGYERDWSGFLPKQRDMLKAGITIPLKFSNFNKGTVRQARYFIDQNEAHARHLELQVQTEISQAYFRYEALGKQVDLFDSGLLEEAEALLEGMTFRYKGGEIDILELLIAQRTHNEVREQHLETMKEYASSVIELQKSAGIWEIRF
ncbi:MAG: TolC family protein [Rikenellaceae bacterium]|nr:TolC family protein [Rikenellaceae bacterium]